MIVVLFIIIIAIMLFGAVPILALFGVTALIAIPVIIILAVVLAALGIIVFLIYGFKHKFNFKEMQKQSELRKKVHDDIRKGKPMSISLDVQEKMKRS